MRQAKWVALIVFATALTCAHAEERAIDRGLDWLARHQETDGHWDSLKHSASKKTDTAVTSLALLALLGAGHSEKVGEYKDNVKRAVAWLKSKQDANGKIFDATDDTEFPREANASALGLLAMAEAAGMANVADTKAAAQKAADYCVEVYPLKKISLPNEGIKYALDKDATTPMVEWYVMALKSVKVAGLRVQHTAFDALIEYLDSVEHTLGKIKDEEVAPREYWYRRNEKYCDGFPSYRMTAIGCLCRQFMGWKREDLQSTVKSFVAQGGLPAWTKDTENVDLYYWYVATLCVFQTSGAGMWHLEPDSVTAMWPAWSEARNKALGENQCTGGDDDGSWNAQGYASREWGRVGQTALARLCLETYVR